MSIILGIDPGTIIMGFAVLESVNNKLDVITLGVEKMDKLPDQNAKLKRIFEKTNELINTYHPNILSIEAPFYGKNVQSMLKLGRAQGVVMAACLNKEMEVFEFSPRKIKQAITGNGNAAKEQISAMLHYMQLIKEDSPYFDATDALAAAVCFHLKNKMEVSQGKFSGWSNFIKQNKDRIIE